MCPKLIELLSWNDPTVHVCCFMLARASTKTFVSRVPKTAKKSSLAEKFVSRITRQPRYHCTVVHSPHQYLNLLRYKQRYPVLRPDIAALRSVPDHVQIRTLKLPKLRNSKTDFGMKSRIKIPQEKYTFICLCLYLCVFYAASCISHSSADSLDTFLYVPQ